MTHQDTLPSKDDGRVLSFCESICPGVTPFYVPVQPWSQSVRMQCFQNAERKAKAVGGRAVYGWSISQFPKVHLEAQFHAIWESPLGKFVDVTYEELGLSQTLFLRDDVRTYTGTKVPHIRLALGAKESVERYWELSDGSQAIALDLLSQGHAPGSPIFRQRLEHMVFEIQNLKARLQNAA